MDGWLGIYNIFNRALKGILNLRKKNYFKVKDVKAKISWVLMKIPR